MLAATASPNSLIRKFSRNRLNQGIDTLVAVEGVLWKIGTFDFEILRAEERRSNRKAIDSPIGDAALGRTISEDQRIGLQNESMVRRKVGHTSVPTPSYEGRDTNNESGHDCLINKVRVTAKGPRCDEHRYEDHHSRPQQTLPLQKRRRHVKRIVHA